MTHKKKSAKYLLDSTNTLPNIRTRGYPPSYTIGVEILPLLIHYLYYLTTLELLDNEALGIGLSLIHI